MQMVAQISNETFAVMSPSPDPSDSDDVSLALGAARVLEAQGDISEAVRWLRRAADEAERDGNDLRVVAFARAAADLSMRAPAKLKSVHPPSPKPATSVLPAAALAAESSPPAPSASR